MTNTSSNHIKNAQWKAVAKTIADGLSVRVSHSTVDIFFKRTVEGLGTISQISRNKRGWTHRKISQSHNRERTWVSAKVSRFAEVEDLLCHMSYSERNAAAPTIIDRYKDDYTDIQSDLKKKTYPERGDIVTILQAGADMDDIIRVVENVYMTEKKGACADIAKVVAPKDIRGILDREIFGNEHAKKTIATAVAKHVSSGGKCRKTNVLITGKSGTGKTEMMRALKKHTEWNHNEIPVVIYDASQLTPVGWKGTNMDDILHQVVAQNPELSKAEQAIIQLDEMDKITECEEYGGNLLKQMLKFIEGGSISAGSRGEFKVTMDGEGKKVSHIDTGRMLFIISGVYAQFDREEKKVIGFNKAASADFAESAARVNMSHDDIIDTGVIPVELMGRIQAVTATEMMSREQWRQCVEEKIKRDYQETAELFNMQLDDIITKEVLDQIVKATYGSKQGLRGSINMIDAIINDAIYENVSSSGFYGKPKAA